MNITTDVADEIEMEGPAHMQESSPRDLHGVLLGQVSSLGLRNRVFARVFGDEPEPLRIGRYRVLERVGAGAMGVVYAAYDNQLDRKIAVKLIHRSQSHGDPNAQTRLLREAQALARLSHPNVVQVHDAGDWDRRVFVAMEFIRGTTLRQWREQQEPDWRTTVQVFLAAGRGLAAAHAAGIVHRDFKPDNVLIAHDGTVKVVDFGLANAEGEPHPTTDLEIRATNEERALTETGMVLGTPAYMAPEQFAGERADARADQFAFCVALYEALWGKRPFEGSSFEELAKSIAKGPPEPPRDAVPARIRSAIRRGLSTKQEDRFESIESLLAELERSLVSQRWWMVLGGLLLAAVAFATWAWIDYAQGEGERSAALAEEVERERARATELEGVLAEHRFDHQLEGLERLRAIDPTAALLQLRESDKPVLETGRGRALLAGLTSDWTAKWVTPLQGGSFPIASTTSYALFEAPDQRWVTRQHSDRKIQVSPGRVTTPRSGDCFVTHAFREFGGEAGFWSAPSFEPVLLGYDLPADKISIADGCAVVSIVHKQRAAIYEVESGLWSKFEPDGYSIEELFPSSRWKRFAVVDQDFRLVIVDGERVVRPLDELVLHDKISWSPDGNKIAAVTRSGRLFTMQLGGGGYTDRTQFGGFKDAVFGPNGRLFTSRVNLAGGAELIIYDDPRTVESTPLVASAGRLQIGPNARYVIAHRESGNGIDFVDTRVGSTQRLTAPGEIVQVFFSVDGVVSMTDEEIRYWDFPVEPALTTPIEPGVLSAYRTDSRGWFMLDEGGGIHRAVADGAVQVGARTRTPRSSWQEYNRRLAAVSRDGATLALAQVDGLTVLANGHVRKLDVAEGVPALTMSPDGRRLAYAGLNSLFVAELDEDGSVRGSRSACSDCQISARRGLGWVGSRPWTVVEGGCDIILGDMGSGVDVIESPLEYCSGVDVTAEVVAWRGFGPDGIETKIIVQRLTDGRRFETAARPGEVLGLYVAVVDSERVLFSEQESVFLWNFGEYDGRLDRDLTTREVLRTAQEITSLQRQPDGGFTVMDGLYRVWDVPVETDEERIARLDSMVEVVGVEQH